MADFKRVSVAVGVALLVLLLVVSAPVGTLAAPSLDKQDNGATGGNGQAAVGLKGFDKVVFVHYPRGKARPAPGAGTVTESTSYKYTGVRWPSSSLPVPYSIDPVNGWGLATADVTRAVEASFGEWTRYSKVRFTAGEVASAGNPLAGRDARNTVSWRRISAQYPNAIGITYTWYSRATKLIVEADTVLNDDFRWAVSDYESTGAPTDAYDVEDITTHEAGHWLMLGDLYKPKDALLTMYGYGSLGETIKDSLGVGDKRGVQAIYGAP